MAMLRLNTKKWLFLYGFLTFFLTGFSQQNIPGPPNDLDKQFMPDKNSIFNSGKDGVESRRNAEVADIKQAIQFNPGLLLRKQFAIFYERSLNDNLCLQGAIGTCYGIDPILTAFAQASDLGLTPSSNSYSSSSVSLGQLLQAGEYQGGLNPFLALNFKIYTGTSIGYWRGSRGGYSEAFSGGYFQIGVRYTSVNILLTPASFNNVTSDYTITTNIPLQIRSTYYSVIYGYQFYTAGKFKTTHDFYSGFGLRVASSDGLTPVVSNVTNSYGTVVSTSSLVLSGGSRQVTYFPAFMMGYVFGFGY